MKKIYEKPILEVENVQIEDVCAVSVNADEGVSLPTPSSNVTRWGRKQLIEAVGCLRHPTFHTGRK